MAVLKLAETRFKDRRMSLPFFAISVVSPVFPLGPSEFKRINKISVRWPLNVQ